VAAASRAAQRRARLSATAESGSASSSSAPNVTGPAELFAFLERTLREAAAGAGAGGWEEVERAWVLLPAGEPLGVVHFTGGAFAGASPQLTYRLFLETLCSKGRLVVVATPFATSLDHLRVADEAQFAFDRALKTLADSARIPPNLPVWGVGHSMGSLAQLLIASRYAVTRAGMVLMSYNNKPATDAIPLFLPVVSPLAQGLSPLLNGLVTSPLRGGVEALSAQLRGRAPPLLREALPLLDQLQPLGLDVAAGRVEFSPNPEETQRLVRSFYGVQRTLLLRFRDDTIDETPALAATLTATATACEVTVSSLPGDHVRPLQQLVPPPPPEVLGAAQQGAAAVEQLSQFADSLGALAFAPAMVLGALRAGVRAGVDTLEAASPGGQGALADINALVDELLSWMQRDKAT